MDKSRTSKREMMAMGNHAETTGQASEPRIVERTSTEGEHCPDEEAVLTTEAEYRRRIARHRRGGLLQLIAALAAEYSGPRNIRGWHSPDTLGYTPWALADVARVSLAANTRSNRVPATRQDLDHILALYNNLDEPMFDEGAGLAEAESFFLRIAGSQLVFQDQDYQIAARAAAVLLQTSFAAGAKPRCIKPGWDQELFGCSLVDYVGTARILWWSALQKQGRFCLWYIFGPGAPSEWQTLDPSQVRRTLDTHFAIAATDFPKENRRAAAVAHDRRLRRYTYNPLRGRPAVTGLGPDYLCPIPQLAWAKASLSGLYFTGFDHFGNDFAQDLGDLFEQYVGRQLDLIPGITLLPEISYKEGRENKRSVDWIVVFDELVLLVEVKSAAPTEENRLGGPNAWHNAANKVGHGFEQIEKATNLIKGGHPDFHAVPTDHRFLGLVITREPFYSANWPGIHRLFPTTSVPTIVASISELEKIVTLTDATVDRFLTGVADDPERRRYDLFTSLPGRKFASNPVLDAGWKALPWGPTDPLPGSER